MKNSQLDVLWDCLSTDDVGREFLYCWLLEQLKSSNKHAIDADLLTYILQTKVGVTVEGMYKFYLKFFHVC